MCVQLSCGSAKYMEVGHMVHCQPTSCCCSLHIFALCNYSPRSTGWPVMELGVQTVRHQRTPWASEGKGMRVTVVCRDLMYVLHYRLLRVTHHLTELGLHWHQWSADDHPRFSASASATTSPDYCLYSAAPIVGSRRQALGLTRANICIMSRAVWEGRRASMVLRRFACLDYAFEFSHGTISYCD
jgi:hypothetical protein